MSRASLSPGMRDLEQQRIRREIRDDLQPAVKSLRSRTQAIESRDLQDQIDTLTARIAALEAALGGP